MGDDEAGFTLLEMALTLVVMAVLVSLGVGLQLGATQADQAAVQRARLSQAHEAVLAFALALKRLPCPDLTGSGAESLAADGVDCAGTVGWLPYVSLALQRPNGQAGNTRMRYGVYSGAAAAGGTSGALEAFASAIALAASSAPDTQYPYVPGAQGCGVAKFNPAFALATTGAAAAAVPGNLCFAAGQGTQAVQVDVESLTDLQAQLRQNEASSGAQ